MSNLIARPFQGTVGRNTGITINDWRLMIVIAERPGLSQAEIVAATGFNKATVSRLLRNLDKYVQLESHAEDSRKHSVHLTDDGWDVYNRAVPVLLWRQQLLTKSLPAKELAQFRSTLAKLIESARGWQDLPEETPTYEG
ncbi:MAG: winged helix-turn-helix transcriptional regulator [Ramlibacter sp.]|nr:winged helix-turn-helix transcriptional regulator [Ramlibacter sp.]